MQATRCDGHTTIVHPLKKQVGNKIVGRALLGGGKLCFLDSMAKNSKVA